VSGKSVRPVCWPAVVQAVSPCLARHTLGRVALIALLLVLRGRRASGAASGRSLPLTSSACNGPMWASAAADRARQEARDARARGPRRGVGGGPLARRHSLFTAGHPSPPVARRRGRWIGMVEDAPGVPTLNLNDGSSRYGSPARSRRNSDRGTLERRPLTAGLQRVALTGRDGPNLAPPSRARF
jgi:hypothetical protein